MALRLGLTLPVPCGARNLFHTTGRILRDLGRTQAEQVLLAPSIAYLEATSILTTPPVARKLVVLDLNGCLLYRDPPGAFRNTRTATSPDRTSHPRPYMPSLRRYLFHPSTREWLDTIVWSSAQPRNVCKMVQTCFLQEQSKIVAIWARDKMDLNSFDYRACISSYTSMLFQSAPRHVPYYQTASPQQ